MDVTVPLDVPKAMVDTYKKNYEKATRGSDRLMLFAGDQKIEHLNDDYYGQGVAKDDNSPKHMFEIAAKANVGVFATQLGMIARYGGDFPKVPYLVKLNSKSHLVKVGDADPTSQSLHTVAQVAEFAKNSGLNILGVGYTIYWGSQREAEMLTEAAQAIYEAHQHGLLSVVWAYPRGKAVADEKDAHLIAGAAGATACLGADFVKVNPPNKKEGMSSAEGLKEASEAAGRTKLVCAGGSNAEVEPFLKGLYDQIHTGGASGNATGRNIHQRPLAEAVRFTNAIYAITVENKSVAEAMKVYSKD